MPRPKKCRRIEGLPDVTYFKPRGVPLRDLNEVYLPVEGFEALRLIDVENLNQEQASARMHVSRQTFGRILAEARCTVAKALVEGMAIRIDGGDYTFDAAVEEAGQQAGRVNPKNTHENQTEKERSMNKIAISSEGPALEDQMDPRFGRAAGFVIVDLETMSVAYLDNGSSQAMAQGAGIQAAEIVASSGAQAVLTGHVGPKAFMALEAAGIKVAQNLQDMTVGQALDRFKQGQLEWSAAPNKQGHWK